MGVFLFLVSPNFCSALKLKLAAIYQACEVSHLHTLPKHVMLLPVMNE